MLFTKHQVAKVSLLWATLVCVAYFFYIFCLHNGLLMGKRGFIGYWSLGNQVSGQPLKFIDLVSFEVLLDSNF